MTRSLSFPAYSRAERTSAFRAAERFAMSDRFAAVAQQGDTVFWGDRLERLDEDRARQLMDDDGLYGAYRNWLIFDCELRDMDPPRSGTIADALLAVRGRVLTRGERTLLERMAASTLRLYEVTAVRLDEGLTLRDLWTEQSVEVSERIGTHDLVRWDLLAVRLIEGEHGQTVIEGNPYLFPADSKPVVIEALRRLHRRLRKPLPPNDPAAFFKRLAPAIHQLWADLVPLRARPEFVTIEGDPIEPTTVTFDMTDAERVARELEQSRELNEGPDGTYTWLGDASDTTRIMGVVAVHGRHLTLETMSAASVAEPPDDVSREALRQVYDRHYRSWVDEPIPMLGGRTPRHAARLKTQRPVLVNLLKTIENGMERQGQPGSPAYDIGWIWKELGLEGERSG